MRHMPDCLLYSTDADLVRRVSAYASGMVRLHAITDAGEVRVGLSHNIVSGHAELFVS